MSGPPMIRRASVVALAFGGVALGHAITYVGLAPGAVAREMMFAATGHGYLGVANRVGLLVVMASLAAILLGRVVGRGGDLEPASVRRRLVAFQILGFVALEIAERLGSGAPLGDLVAILPAGITIQIAVAFAIAAAVRSFLRAVDNVVACTASPASLGRRDALAFAIPVGRSFQPVSLPASVGGRAPPRSR